MISLETEADTQALGARVAALLRPGDVVALSGDLGAGKTTFARGLVQALGHAGEVPSPTFPIVQIYEPPDTRLPLWHVDLYRISHPEEIEELGLDEALEDCALIIEWPQRLRALWPQTLQLSLAPATQGRALTAIVPAAWTDRWPPA
jgi:tRNA threonylcarbamoyladenosine biosynthesis protein TsaE